MLLFAISSSPTWMFSMKKEGTRTALVRGETNSKAAF